MDHWEYLQLGIAELYDGRDQLLLSVRRGRFVCLFIGRIGDRFMNESMNNCRRAVRFVSIDLID